MRASCPEPDFWPSTARRCPPRLRGRHHGVTNPRPGERWSCCAFAETDREGEVAVSQSASGIDLASSPWPWAFSGMIFRRWCIYTAAPSWGRSQEIRSACGRGRPSYSSAGEFSWLAPRRAAVLDATSVENHSQRRPQARGTRRINAGRACASRDVAFASVAANAQQTSFPPGRGFTPMAPS